MNWTDVSPEQVREAEIWWNSRTPQQIEREWPRPLRDRAGTFTRTGWRVFGGEERCRMAITLMGAGLICVARVPRIERVA